MITLAQPKHLLQLLKLEQEVFPTNRLSKASLKRFINLKKVFVILKFNKVVASMIVLTRKDTSAARVYSLAVGPDYQNQGLGKQLLDFIPTLSNQITEIRLEVRVDNIKAVRFYQRHGFVEFGAYLDYYKDGCNAKRLTLTLNRDC